MFFLLEIPISLQFYFFYSFHKVYFLESVLKDQSNDVELLYICKQKYPCLDNKQKKLHTRKPKFSGLLKIKVISPNKLTKEILL